jgi:uncharacterized protein YndB with AHSA1/START domain
MATQITVEATVKAPVDKVWKYWNGPEHITKWCSASPEWHTPSAENDLRVGGKFTSRMEAKDGTVGFDFEGEYTKVKPNELIEYKMSDGRQVRIVFDSKGNETKVIETFDAERENSEDMQREGWQAILNSFKTYSETH